MNATLPGMPFPALLFNATGIEEAGGSAGSAGIYLFAFLIAVAAAGIVAFCFFFVIPGVFEKKKHMEKKRKVASAVKRHLEQGKHPSEIRKMLITLGRDEKIVRALVCRLELYHYIYHNMRRGHHPSYIRRVLLSQGWSAGVVDSTLKKASSRLYRKA